MSKKILSGITIIAAFLVTAVVFPCQSYAADGGRMFFTIELGGAGNFYSQSENNLRKEKPEAMNLEGDSDAFGGLRFDVQVPYQRFNATWGIAFDVGVLPSFSYLGKAYSWSSFYSEVKPDNGVFGRILYTTDYFIIGNARQGNGLALSSGIGVAGGEIDITEDAYDAETISFSGLSYEYGLALYMREDKYGGVFSVRRTHFIKSSDFDWKTWMFTIGFQYFY